VGTRRRFFIGVLFGLVAAIGQGAGGVLSRIAYRAQDTLGDPASTLEGILLGAAAGYQRLLGGVLLLGAIYFASQVYRPWRTPPVGPHALDPNGTKVSWVLINALTGPIVGVIFFQWALMTTDTAIVQSIVALTPITVIPLAYWLEGERPRPRSILGGVVAVAGVVLLALAPTG
jgi:drug/metabolite transporter (DMT)-like permease